MTLDNKPVISCTTILVVTANNTLCGSKLSIFILCQQSLKYEERSCSMKIFDTFPTINIPKLNFWLVICIAKKFIWTTLKAIFLIFWFFLHPQIPDFQILYLGQILLYPNKPYKIHTYDWFCGPGSHKKQYQGTHFPLIHLYIIIYY